MSRKRLAPARWTLPEVVRPGRTVCFQIEVPDEQFHIAAFFGAIYDLAKPYKWANDNAHTAIEVGAVWLEIFEKLRRGNCPVPNNNGTDGDDFMIRQNPDNPCLLESSVDGTNWCTWADLSLCLAANPGQPSGGGQPAPGECREFNATLNGANQWLLPFQVNEGDTITIEAHSGAWTDGTYNWFCPDGQAYVLGGCAGSQSTDPGDPMPTAFHMALIASDGTNFYDVMAGTQTVPPGVTNANLVFQANDTPLTDNFGEITFKVKVCAKQSLAAVSIYGGGTGPVGNLPYGTAFTYSSTYVGGLAAHNIAIEALPCGSIEIVSQSGWSDPSATQPVLWGYRDCAGTDHNFTAGSPPPFPPAAATACDKLGINSATAFSITVKFHP